MLAHREIFLSVAFRLEAAEIILPVAAHEEVETIHNMKPEQTYFQAVKEAIFVYCCTVNDIRSEKLARSANPLALLAAAQPNSDNYYEAPVPQRSNAPSYKQSSSTRQVRLPGTQGKEIAKPVTPQSVTVSEKAVNPEQQEG
ncbi:hypothetical protein Tco_0894769 [Tanacetum coccineum]|uniref:Uncharacterized protein n=1 Tax=Tanacetum coccineum TaxID=301880 RepID=A0ABQ5CE40_9ASTR